MKKIRFTVISLFVLMIVPSIASASWWNPFSWFKNYETPKIEVVNKALSASSSLSTNNVTSSTKAPATLNVAVSKKEKTQEVNKNTGVIKTEDQICIETFGKNIMYTGKKNETGQPYCDCKDGYEFDTTGKTCQVKQVQKPSGTLCNGTYWSACPNGQNFVCPPTGSAYCQDLSQPVTQSPVGIGGANTSGDNRTAAQIEQDNASQIRAAQNETNVITQQIVQQKINQDEKSMLTSEYNTAVGSIQQKILDIKSQYYIDLDGLYKRGGDQALADGWAKRILNEANTKIEVLNLQLQQLYLDYLKKLNNYN